MTQEELLKNLHDNFGSRILSSEERPGRKIFIAVAPQDIVAVTKHLLTNLHLRFNITSAVDTFEGIEMLYHFSLDGAALVISVRTLIRDKKDPHIETITTVTKAAWWIEREIHELFGVFFDGNADLRPLLLPDSWPKGIFPLRKDFIAPKRDSRKG